MFETGKAYEADLLNRIESGSMGFRKMFDLKDKIAVITGAAGGLGRPVALGLADFGAKIALIDMDLEKAETVKKEIEKIGSDAIALRCDVTDPEDVKKMVDQTVNRFGCIDILIPFAGVNITKPAEEYPYEDWKKVIDVNLNGVFLCNQQVGKVMIQQGQGRIINISSVRGQFGAPKDYAGYCTTKGAINMLTRTLACEWGKHNINVNAIAPSGIETPLTSHIFSNPDPDRPKPPPPPLGRRAFQDDLIGAIVFFASDASNYITGQILLIDGGLTA